MDVIRSFLAEYKFYIFISVLLVFAILGWHFIDKIQYVSYYELKINRKVDEFLKRETLCPVNT